MIISKEGKIAYHAYRLRPDGTGIDYVQYDFDGEVLFKEKYKDYPLPDFSKCESA